MLDGVARKTIDPMLNAMGRELANAGVSANSVTVAGFLISIVAATAIAFGHFWLGAMLILISRLCDGLDGVVARYRGATDFGGYLDIVLDFAFYGMIPAAFAYVAPGANGLAAAILLFSFYVNGASFLAFSILAEKKKLKGEPRGKKTIFFTTGLAEATETLAIFVLMCLRPDWFAPLAYGFAAICFWTAANRIWLAKNQFG